MGPSLLTPAKVLVNVERKEVGISSSLITQLLSILQVMKVCSGSWREWRGRGAVAGSGMASGSGMRPRVSCCATPTDHDCSGNPNREV